MRKRKIIILRSSIAALAVIVCVSGTRSPAWAWGATGHEWVSGIAIEMLPGSLC